MALYENLCFVCVWFGGVITDPSVLPGVERRSSGVCLTDLSSSRPLSFSLSYPLSQLGFLITHDPSLATPTVDLRIESFATVEMEGRAGDESRP